jgi:hemolysin III
MGAMPHLDVHGLVKPLLRGRIHAVGLMAAIPAGIVLVASARSAPARAGAAVFALSLIALYSASTAYHRLGRGERSQRILRRLDHSSIYLLIAGSYTPLCLVALPRAWGAFLLVLVWGAAITGVVMKLVLFDSCHRIGGVLYIAMGWAAVLATPALVRSLDGGTLGLLAGGGVLYTVGAIVLATRFPNPFPRVFGYHEVWHLMVVVAGVLHYAAIHEVVTGT